MGKLADMLKQLSILTATLLGCGVLAHAQPLVSVAVAAKPAPAPIPIDSKPSRYAGEKIDDFIAEMSQVLAMRTRTTGPFGELQDPDAKPAPLPSELVPGKRIVEPALSLAEITQMISITTVMPGERRFLIGTRSIREGEEFPVTLKGRKHRIQVVQVSSDRIVFRNPTTGETAIHPLNMLPPGMSPGSGENVVPGMQPASQEAPINLDPSSP